MAMLIVGLLVFLGVHSIAIVSPGLRARAVARLGERRWKGLHAVVSIVGFVVLVITGVLLFYAIPIRTFHSLWFRIKLTLLLIGGINILIFTFKVERDKARWDLGPVPLKSKIAASISLSVWALVIVCGRLIAYNWADCDVTTSPWVLTLAGCPNQEN